MKFEGVWGVREQMGNVRVGRAHRTWRGSRPCPPGRLHWSSRGLGMFGDIVGGPLAYGRESEAGERSLEVEGHLGGTWLL